MYKQHYIEISFLKNIYLFIWLCWVLVAAHGIFVVVCRLLSSCGMRAVECTSSVVQHMGSLVGACVL